MKRKEVLRMKKQWIAIFLCLSLLATGLLGLTGCAAKVQADDLMKDITPGRRMTHSKTERQTSPYACSRIRGREKKTA